MCVCAHVYAQDFGCVQLCLCGCDHVCMCMFVRECGWVGVGVGGWGWVHVCVCGVSVAFALVFFLGALVSVSMYMGNKKNFKRLGVRVGGGGGAARDGDDRVMGVGEDGWGGGGGEGAGERTQKPRCTCEQFVRPYSSRFFNLFLFTFYRLFVTLYFKNRCRVNCVFTHVQL